MNRPSIYFGESTRTCFFSITQEEEVINGKRVVVWTPFGREVTMSILVEYIRRDVERGIVDEYVLYMNTDDDQESDRAYGYSLGEKYDWITIQERPMRHPGPKQRSTGYFYRSAVDPDTVYVRLDDDIVYVHEDAIANLVKARVEMPSPVAVFGTTWNNAIVSWFMQQAGVIPREWGECTYFCMDPTGWANGQFAVKIHELLLEKVEAGRAEDLFLYQDFPIQAGTQFSVSCFASTGEFYRDLPNGPGVLVPDEEESFHTIHEPARLGRDNILIGNAIVSHLTFMPQRSIVLGTNILDRYRTLTEKL